MSVELNIDNGLGIVTLNRPEKKNAITMTMRLRLSEVFEQLGDDDTVRAVIIRGAGTDFCAGMDVQEMGAGGVASSMMRMRRLQRVVRAIADLRKPAIAAVRGVCMGAGWSYAMACDFVVADNTARFAQAFRNIGLCPDAGAVWQLRQLLGPMRAKEIVYSGRVIDAEEALKLGLILEKTAPGALMDRAHAIAAGFINGPTLAIGMAKRQFELAANSGFDQFLEAEFSMQPAMSGTDDHAEGLAAFRHRRPPCFKGS